MGHTPYSSPFISDLTYKFQEKKMIFLELLSFLQNQHTGHAPLNLQGRSFEMDS